MESGGELDTVETLILTMLDYDKADTSNKLVEPGKGKGKRSVLCDDQGKYLRFDRMFPSSVNAIGVGDSDRLYTGDKDLLMAHPGEILQQETEICIINDKAGLTWQGFRRMKKKPKGLVPLGKIDMLFERHCMVFSNNKKPIYQKRLVAFDKLGGEVPVLMRGHYVGYNDGLGIITASVIEDFARPGVVSASITENIEIKFTIPITDYKEVFIIRDSPLTKAGKKKAILHFVKKHIRKPAKGNEPVEVHKYSRGVDEFYIDTMRVKVGLIDN